MKTIKYLSLMMALVSVMTIGLTSCNDDDDDVPAPVVTLEEANIEGNELCVEADIIAQGRTTSIVIEICNAAETTVKVAYPVTASKYIGVLNIEGFHVHVPIAGKGVEVGDMLKLTVKDANGRLTTAKKYITEEEDGDETPHHD